MRLGGPPFPQCTGSPSPPYLDVKLKVAPVHLPGHHALDDLHGNQLEAVEGGAEDVVGVALLDLQVEEPVEPRVTIRRHLLFY